MQNIEIKVEVPRLEPIRKICTELNAVPQWVRSQKDTYFRVIEGRLKLREEAGSATLIAYARPEQVGSRTSHYELYPVPDPARLKRTLEVTPGRWLTVEKQRELWLLDRTRIHLDTVEQLGCFVELETVVTDQSHAEAREEHQRILDALGLGGMRVIAGSYSDMLAE